MSSDVTELQSNGAGVRASLSLLNIQKGFNPRANTEPSDSLITSVKKHGVQNPVHVRTDPDKPGKYIIVDGERRLKAAKKAGKKDIPVVPAGELDDAEALILSLISNEDQESLSPYEKAKAIQRILKSEFDDGEGGITTPSEKDVAQALGVSVRTIRETLKVLDSDNEALRRAAAEDDLTKKIPVRVAARLADLPKSSQKKLLKKLQGLSTKDGLALIRKEEELLKATRRGRKPRKTPIARDAHARLEMLYYLVMARLDRDPHDERALAHLEAIWIVQGVKEVTELYDGNAKVAKRLAKITEVRASLKRLEEERMAQENKTQSKKKATKKKVSKKKAVSKKATKRKASKKKLVKRKSGKKKASKKGKRGK